VSQMGGISGSIQYYDDWDKTTNMDLFLYILCVQYKRLRLPVILLIVAP
jgi:hypothetical protein